MNRTQLKGLAALNGYQVAGLAFVASTVAAVTTLIVLRRTILRPPPSGAASSPTSPDVPGHFSENLTIPGFTATGEQVADQDAREGRSPEGV